MLYEVITRLSLMSSLFQPLCRYQRYPVCNSRYTSACHWFSPTAWRQYMLVLVINCGSSSLKFQLIDAKRRVRRAGGVIERIGAVSSIATIEVSGERKQRRSLTAGDHAEAMKYVLDLLLNGSNPVIGDVNEISAVGHRVVHGGETLTESVLIDSNVLEAISVITSYSIHYTKLYEMGAALARHLPDSARVPTFGGTSYWVKGPEKVDAQQLQQQALRHGISYNFV